MDGSQIRKVRELTVSLLEEYFSSTVLTLGSKINTWDLPVLIFSFNSNPSVLYPVWVFGMPPLLVVPSAFSLQPCCLHYQPDQIPFVFGGGVLEVKPRDGHEGDPTELYQQLQMSFLSPCGRQGYSSETKVFKRIFLFLFQRNHSKYLDGIQLSTILYLLHHNLRYY